MRPRLSDDGGAGRMSNGELARVSERMPCQGVAVVLPLGI